MYSYKEVFDAAASKAGDSVDYSDFRHNTELFHFIMAPKHLMGPEQHTLNQAKEINELVYDKLMEQGPSRVGGGPTVLDTIECRHILMVTYLTEQIGTFWGNVLEIGGGYGNFCRLAHAVSVNTNWTIIDLKHVAMLQRWFLEQFDIYPDILLSDFPHLYTYKPNLVIGTHSLSELSLEDFETYFTNIKESSWFFYVSHNSHPSSELLQAKMNIITEEFGLKDAISYESGSCTMYLFKNRRLLT